MRFNIKKELLLKGVNYTERNVGRNLTLPVLNNILIKAERDKVRFISTDLDMAVMVEVPTQIEKEGSLVVPPKTLSGLLSNLPDAVIQLKEDKNTLFLEYNNYKTSIKGESDKDFPLLPNISREEYITVSSSDIVNALGQVINSVSSSELKPELTGVLFDIGKNEFKLASTDSFRLSEKKVKFNNASGVVAKVIIPLKTANEIIRSYQNIGGEIVIYIDDSQLVLENKENRNIKLNIISKFIDGDYPDYTQIIPKEFNTKVIVSKKEFVQQVKGSSLFTSRINDVRLIFSGNRINIHAENYDVGEFDSSVEATITGDEKEMVFNHQYLLDGLNNIEGDEVIIKINKQDGPVIFESTEKKDYFHILMPLRR